MDLYLVIPDLWMWFCILFGVVLITTLIMNKQATVFITYDASRRKFSILDLQFPSSAKDLVNIINGIYKLDATEKVRVERALKGNLYIDFLFMPAIHGCVFLLCMNVASKSTAFGHPAFAVVAWLQCFAWLFDFIENVYLLNKIHADAEESGLAVHKTYRRIVYSKWIISLLGGICSLMVVLYYFLAGYYLKENLIYLVILVSEIIVFMLIRKFLMSK